MDVKLWAVSEGTHPGTVCRMFRDGTLPVPARRVGKRLMLVGVDEQGASTKAGGSCRVGLYARASSHDRKADLGRQLLSLYAWAGEIGATAVRTGSKVGSGVNGSRQEIRRSFPGPVVQAIVVKHRDRPGMLNTEPVESAPAAGGRAFR